jgi:hypothetical protein
MATTMEIINPISHDGYSRLVLALDPQLHGSSEGRVQEE